MRKMIVCPDFPDLVLWEAGAPVTLDSLPLSHELREALDEWYRQWSRIEDDYRFKMESDAKIDWAEFDSVGIELWKRLRQELSEGFEIAFFSHRFGESFEEPQELSELLRSSRSA